MAASVGRTAGSIVENAERDPEENKTACELSVAIISSMDRDACMEAWRQRFGHSPAKNTSAAFMRRVLAHEVQIERCGDVSRAVQKALQRALKSGAGKAGADGLVGSRDRTGGAALNNGGSVIETGGLVAENSHLQRPAACRASSAKRRRPEPPVLHAGMQLVREWNGRTYVVDVTDDGFRLDGKPFRSLTKLAKHITGTHQSGPRFFGLAR